MTKNKLTKDQISILKRIGLTIKYSSVDGEYDIRYYGPEGKYLLCEGQHFSLRGMLHSIASHYYENGRKDLQKEIRDLINCRSNY